MKRGEMEACRRTAREELLARRRPPSGCWRGALSASALSTATAACALELGARALAEERAELRARARAGRAWLRQRQNADGGWGDTPASPSNLSTTTLCWVALGMVKPDGEGLRAACEGAANYLREATGGDLDPQRLAAAIRASYGADHTFSAPILTMAALGGRLGAGKAAWRCVPSLPFELAALPRGLFAWIGLPVVSYALPALIAIGQVRHHHLPARNPLARWLRELVRGPTLRLLAAIQPSSGGFLEAVPLTSFVAMSLIAMGAGAHPVARRALAFLRRTGRADGSWPIDVDLATWVSTLCVHALERIEGDRELLEWLLGQQVRERHPYTRAAPGGWAWTDLPGGVPDGDDTAGALLAIHKLAGPGDPRVLAAARAGVRWLLDLQNRDGGLPTFCRGWGKLPFDRSAPDLTAHALRAWSAWAPNLRARLGRRAERAIDGALDFLHESQRSDGTWVPLWFGNQGEPRLENPLYGTTRVLLAAQVRARGAGAQQRWESDLARAREWLLDAQHPSGGWGGAPALEPTIEESALAVEALSEEGVDERSLEAMRRGCAWLVERTRAGTHFEAAPIGLYFAKLWYHEDLYPLIFTVSALTRFTRLLGRSR